MHMNKIINQRKSSQKSVAKKERNDVIYIFLILFIKYKTSIFM